MKIKVLGIENTTYCGANCIMCPRENYQFKFSHMGIELFKRVIDEGIKCGVELFQIAGFGDPCLDPFFREELEYAKTMYPDIKLVISTTCHMVKGEMLDLICKYVDEVQISMYGITKKSYESIHRGSLIFEDIKANINRLLSKKERPFCLIKFIEMEENAGETEKWISYYQGRADRIDVWKSVHNWGGYLENKEKDTAFKKCFRIESMNGMYVRVDGSVSICCMDYNRRLVLGNILEDSLSEIISSKFAENLRKMNEDGSIANYSLCSECDQIRDRSQSLLYSSDPNMAAGKLVYCPKEDVYG